MTAKLTFVIFSPSDGQLNEVSLYRFILQTYIFSLMSEAKSSLTLKLLCLTAGVSGSLTDAVA